MSPGRLVNLEYFSVRFIMTAYIGALLSLTILIVAPIIKMWYDCLVMEILGGFI